MQLLHQLILKAFRLIALASSSVSSMKLVVTNEMLPCVPELSSTLSQSQVTKEYSSPHFLWITDVL